MLLLFSVLAGLFLMHGLTGGGLGGDSCHGMPPMPMAMAPGHGVPAQAMATRPVAAMHRMSAVPVAASKSASVSASASGGAPAGTPAAAPAMVSGPDPFPGHPQIGETCVPLRPEGLSGLFLALFLIVITVWRPRLPFDARPIRAHWPNGPPRTGVQVLHTLSISRT
ncbi:MAG: hypothetical protein HOW97_41855 [Catenulispora sp.]|nr:hypothetical protein [Catenulispora sp.]